MKRALAIATLLRRKISAKTAAVRGRSAKVETKLPSEKSAAKAAVARRPFDRKPPEPAPSVPRRVFSGAPRLRDRA